MVRITAEQLGEITFLDNDDHVVDPDTTPYVLMPHPKQPRKGRPCEVCIVTKGDLGYVLLDLELDSREEAERACRAVNARMGWTEEDVDRIILASMGGAIA